LYHNNLIENINYLTGDSGLARELHDTKAMTTTGNSILVVEDEKLLSWSLAKSLSKWGFDVHPAFTGNDALALLEKSGFELILLDYQLPDMDGLQVARRIRKAQPKAVIFLVTAFQLNELSVDAGLIDAYFNKPLDFEQLREVLSDRLAASGDGTQAGRVQPRP
jgi:DNA-binding response OmpR family regulator